MNTFSPLVSSAAAPFGFLPPMLPGGLYLLGGEGKTTLAVQSARAAAEAGVPTAFASLEMTGQDVLAKLLATYGVPFEEMASRRPVGAARRKLAVAMSKAASLPLTIIDTVRTPDDVFRLQQEQRYGFLVVDAFEDFDWMEAGERASAADMLGQLAVDARIPVLVVGRPFRRPPNDGRLPRFQPDILANAYMPTSSAP